MLILCHIQTPCESALMQIQRVTAHSGFILLLLDDATASIFKIR